MKKTCFSVTVFLVVFFCNSLSANAAPHAQTEVVWRYTVKPGDTLIGIAERYLTHTHYWASVQQSNQIKDPYHILPGTVLHIPARFLRKSASQAIVENVYGTVRWRMPNGAWQELKQGQALAEGSALQTEEQGTASLLFADGSRTLISPNTSLTLDTISLYADGFMVDTRMRLDRGNTEVLANPKRAPYQKFQIQTPSAHAFVRGTRFRISADTTQTREETVEGKVDVKTAKKGLRIHAGYGTIARQGERPSPPIKLLAAPSLTYLPTRIEHLPLHFKLPHSNKASSWQGRIASDSSFSTVLFDKTVSGESLSYPDLPNGDYVLRLRAIDANGLQGMDGEHAFTVYARPFPPGLNYPGDQALVRKNTPRFLWGKIIDIERYHIQIAAQADFATLLYDETLDADAWTVPTELPETQLFWRAASITPSGQQGPWSTPSAFTYKRGPGSVDAGQAALKIDADSIQLSLPEPPEGLVYEMALSNEATMEPILSSARANGRQLSMPKPEGGSYFLGVRLVDPSDNTPGPFSVQKIDTNTFQPWVLLLFLIPFAL